MAQTMTEFFVEEISNGYTVHHQVLEEVSLEDRQAVAAELHVELEAVPTHSIEEQQTFCETVDDVRELLHSIGSNFDELFAVARIKNATRSRIRRRRRRRA